ncbi:MAG: hypothetical protein Q8N67_05400 [Candidatus Omnitrophota bacterium]|nr:hypothetical protein [Candidatus Omnitrophota bacterium]
MSIVNDALKKAGKEFEFKSQDTVSSGHETAPSSDKKLPMIIPMAFIIMAVLFGALILYKDMSRSNAFVGAGLKPAPTSMIQSTLNNIEQKNTAKAMKPQNIAKLNGIVYGDENKWAIVNDKIVKEGDSLLGGEIISITRDFVKIEKKDGTELTLSLK